MSRMPLSLQPLARALLATIGFGLFHELLAYGLAELGLVARLLSPSPSPLTYLALFFAIALYLVRFGLVFVAPPVLVVTFTRGIAALLASGTPPPPAPAGNETRRRGVLRRGEDGGHGARD